MMFYRIVKEEEENRRVFLINSDNITYIQIQKNLIEVYIVGCNDYPSFVFTEEEWGSKVPYTLTKYIGRYDVL